MRNVSPVLLIGLRDYGTASWEGGGAGCDHVAVNTRRTFSANSIPGPAGSIGKKAGSRNETKEVGGTCGTCGATRVDQQIGLEPTVDAYVAEMVAVFRAVRRVLRDDGVLFLNLGDSYCNAGSSRNGEGLDGSRRGGATGADGALGYKRRDLRHSMGAVKPKDLIGVPWRVAFALQQPWLTCRGCGTEHHLSHWASFPNGRRICPACEMSKGHDISESGWYLRSDIIWAKPNPMPESVRDRPTKAHESIFLLTKSPRYFWDAEAVKEEAADPRRPPQKTGTRPTQALYAVGPMSRGKDGLNHQFSHPERAWAANGNGSRNIRSVWTIATSPFSAAHFATFPPALAERCITVGTSETGACSACGAPWVRVVERTRTCDGQPFDGGAFNSSTPHRIGPDGVGHYRFATETKDVGWQATCACDAPTAPCVVLDPFSGAGTVGLVADRLGRDALLIELNPDYAEMARQRITNDAPMFAVVQMPR